MNRKEACLAEAAVCRGKAEVDAANRDFWIDEAIKWLEVAVNPTRHIAVSVEFGETKFLGDHT